MSKRVRLSRVRLLSLAFLNNILYKICRFFLNYCLRNSENVFSVHLIIVDASAEKLELNIPSVTARVLWSNLHVMFFFEI